MTTTRRRLAVVPVSTAVLLGLLASPSWARTDISGGCSGTDGYDLHSDDEVTLQHFGAGSAMEVRAPDELILGTQSADGTTCDVDGSFVDEIVVRSSTLPAATPVTLQAAFRFDGDVEAVPAVVGTYWADVEAAAAFSVTGERATGEAADLRAATDVDLRVNAYGTDGSVEGSALEDWSHSGDTEGHSGWDRTYDVATRSLDTGWRTVAFTAYVGERLTVDMRLGLFAAAAPGASGTASVDQFEVNVVALTDDVVLDRGDGPAEEPVPVPATAAELVQQARETLAGYQLPEGVANSFDVKLRTALDALAAGDDACDALASFQSHLAALTGKKVTAQQAAEVGGLVAEAQELLGC